MFKPNQWQVLDLFCGAGGLSDGFNRMRFEITGVDNSDLAGKTYELNTHHKFIRADLSKEFISGGSYDVIIGGPPCKPWSSINVTRRGKLHRDYPLLSRYFMQVEQYQPEIFILENVRPLANDITLKRWIRKLKMRLGYSIASSVIRYSDYGASTRRGRLIVVGMLHGNAKRFFQELEKSKSQPATVKHAIWTLRNKDKGEVPDHIWPELKTIDKYRKYYETGKFGWYILKWNESAPSFGNIMKTYILHPDAFNGKPTRVISVKEALLIMGYSKEFHFPEEAGIGARYQMVVDSVSPVFSRLLARVSSTMLNAGG